MGSQAVHGPFLSVPLFFLKDVIYLPSILALKPLDKKNDPVLKLFFSGILSHNAEKLYNGRKEV